jgi:hypothetical protein
MGLNKRLMPGASGYATVSPFQNNVASYSSTSTSASHNTAYLNNNKTDNTLFVGTTCSTANGYSFGANGSSEASNTVTMTMLGPTTTNGFTSIGLQQSYYNYTGYVRWYGSNDGSNWTLLITQHHTGGALSATCTTISGSYSAVAYSYYKVTASGNTRGTYQYIINITPSVVT